MSKRNSRWKRPGRRRPLVKTKTSIGYDTLFFFESKGIYTDDVEGLKVKDNDEKVLEPEIIDRSTIENETQTCEKNDEGEEESLHRQASKVPSVLGKRLHDDEIPVSKAKKAKTNPRPTLSPRMQT